MAKHITQKQMVGYLMYAVAVIMPLSNVPQILQVYNTQVVTGLSLVSWVTYLIFGFIPLSYALINKLLPLIISNVLWTLVNISMIYGIIIYSPNFLPKDFERLLLINNVGKSMAVFGTFFVSVAAALFASDLLGFKHGKTKAD